MLGLILFKIFHNDMLEVLKNYDICSFADDNTIHLHPKIDTHCLTH